MKLFTKHLLFICLTLNVVTSNAQRFEYDLSDRANVSRNYNFDEHLVSTDSNHYLYLSAFNGITILKYDQDFKNVFVDEITTESNDVNHMTLKYSNGQFGWFTVYNNFKKKQFEYELTTIGFDGKLGSPKNIANLRYKSDKRIPKAKFKYSQDSSKIMMALEIDFERTDKYSAYVAVFDYDFNKLYEIDFFPEVNQRKFDAFNWDVANDGKVYLSSIIYDKDNKDGDRKVKGKHVQAYKAMVYQFSEGDKKASELKVPEHFVKSIDILAGKGDNVLITYAYGYRSLDPIEGFKFSLRNSNTFEEIHTDEFAFSLKGLDSYSRLEYFENSRGVGLRPTFEFYESKIGTDGSFEVMLDYHYFVVSSNNMNTPGSFNSFSNTNYSQTMYYDASMFLMKIDATGKLLRSTLLPRRFGSYFEGNTGSTLLSDRKSLLFYNDSQNNLEDNVDQPSSRIGVTSNRKGNFILADIDDLNSIKRSAVFNFSEEELILIPTSIRKLGENKYFFAAYDLRSSAGRYKFGVVDVIY